MKYKLLFLLCITSLILCPCAKEHVSNESKITKETPIPLLDSVYIFELDSIVPDSNFRVMGKFKFRHSQENPIQLNGFWFVDKNGKPTELSYTFRGRFQSIKRKESGKWINYRGFSCGTGASEYPIYPNKNYTFLIPLSGRYFKKGTHLIVGLHGSEVRVESKPFETAIIQEYLIKK